MNRGRIDPSGTKSGHVHRLIDAADVVGEPRQGDVLVFLDGVWKPVSLRRLLGLDSD